MTLELTLHRYPCIRCGSMRRLSTTDQLCWTPEPTDSEQPDTSCWRSAKKARRQDYIQDIASREEAA